MTREEGPYGFFATTPELRQGKHLETNTEIAVQIARDTEVISPAEAYANEVRSRVAEILGQQGAGSAEILAVSALAVELKVAELKKSLKDDSEEVKNMGYFWFLKKEDRRQLADHIRTQRKLLQQQTLCHQATIIYINDRAELQ